MLSLKLLLMRNRRFVVTLFIWSKYVFIKKLTLIIQTSAHPRRLQTNSSPFNFSDSQTASSNEKNYLPFCNPASLFFNPTFSLQAAAAGLKMPQIKLPPTNVNTSNKNRKRKLNTNTSSNNTPSQSRRFYKCLGCGAAKRWDRLTDHYRKVSFNCQDHTSLLGKSISNKFWIH